MTIVDAKKILNDLTLMVNMIIDHTGWDEDKVEIWFKTKNPMLGNAAPIDFIINGRTHKLKRFIESSIEGN